MNKRRSDNCIAKRIWDFIEPYWMMSSTVIITLLTAFIAVVIWINDVNGYADKIVKQDNRIERLEEKIQDIAVIKQRVEDIANFMGVPKKGRK